MANRKATMTDLRVIIREFAKGTPLREIERRLGISRTSLRPYKERAEQSGKSMQELLQLEDAELHNVLSKGDGPGTSDKLPILDSTRPQNSLCSTVAIEDGSYFRIRNIQLGYTIPKKALDAIKFSNIYVYVQAQNPLTFKHTTGYTPEIGGGILNANIDDGGTYPIPTSYTFGINLTF